MMAKGNDVPSSGNALILFPAWENGYVGRFSSDCGCFCRGCNYTVLLSAEHEGYFTVSAKTSGAIEDLNTVNGETYDSVLHMHETCYKYTVKDPEKDFRVAL